MLMPEAGSLVPLLPPFVVTFPQGTAASRGDGGLPQRRNGDARRDGSKTLKGFYCREGQLGAESSVKHKKEINGMVN